MRKVIQIAIEQNTENDYGALYALCDDGSLWQKVFKAGADWDEIQPPSPFGDSKFVTGDDGQLKLGLI